MLTIFKAAMLRGAPHQLQVVDDDQMENKLANLTDVIGELSCNIATMRSDVAKK